MKYKIIFLFFFPLSIFAQKKLPLAINDDFNNNQNNWLIEKTENYNLQIKNGYYIIENHSESSWYFWTFFYNVDFDNFEIETKLIFKATDENTIAYGGIIFFSENANTKNLFEISEDQYFRIISEDTIDTYLDTDWKPCKYVKPGKFNTLRIKKFHKSLLFYVNDKLVYATTKIENFGNSFGFKTNGKTKMMVDYLKIYYKKPKISVVENPLGGKLVNLGPNINTPYTELKPIISPDGSTLFFIREDDPRNIDYEEGQTSNQDIWYSHLLNDSTWAEAQNIGRPINNADPNGVFFISPDNNSIYISKRYNAYGECIGEGISVSYKQPDGSWSIPENIEIDNFYNYNQYHNYALTADKTVLISAIEREDSYGDLDLYVSFLKPDGTYTEPKNMGKVLNTSEADFSPWIAADGKTLYFASYGHPGYGSADIFMSKRLDNTWLHWSKPKNLGPSINSNSWDAYFTLDAKGEYAYVVSSKSGYGNEDIFRIKIPEKVKPEPVVIVYGNVYNQKTGKPISAKVIYYDYKTKEEVGTAISNSVDGSYKIVLNNGQKYQIFSKKRGFFPLSDNIDLTSNTKYKEIKKDLYLIPIEKDQTFVLDNIYFAAGKADLLPESFPELNRIYKMMKENPEIKIEISGHTNNIGDRDKLLELSVKRAEAVKKYLVEKGIQAERIKTIGYGPDKPIASNKTPEGRKKNQRVEFKIIEK